MKKHLKLFTILAAAFTVSTNLFAVSSFSGYAGGKFTLNRDIREEAFRPELNLDGFFSGQFNFNRDFWSHLEFSVNTTDNLLGNNLFKRSAAEFQLDELSLIVRSQVNSSNNYFSIYMGNYDAMGSDTFLRRHFGIVSIASKLTDSFLGVNESLLYPHFGIGISDVIKFEKPTALGVYIYYNKEWMDSTKTINMSVINTDIRYACVLRYLSLDASIGLGFPISKTDSDAYIYVDTLLWHTGLTLLLGNNYTPSIYLQAGLWNLPFKKNEKAEFNTEQIFLMLEPRFIFGNLKCHITFYTLPTDETGNLLNPKMTYLDDTMGLNLNLFEEDITSRNAKMTFGMHAGITFPGRTLFKLGDTNTLFEDFNLPVTPYLNVKIFKGNLNTMVKCNIMGIIRSEKDFLTVSMGYKTQF